MLLQTPSKITIHHTGTPQRPGLSISSKMRSLQRFSQSTEKLADGRSKPAWADVPYHYYIDASGVVAEGRSLKYAGDTNTNYNPRGHIGIVLEGNFQIEEPSESQLLSLTSLVEKLAKTHGIALDQISVHNDYANTLCPGKNLAPLIPGIVAEIER